MSVLVGKKMMAKLASRSNETVGSTVSDFAKRQMAKMGWKEGKGLGKDEQGMTNHVKVQKKDDNTGIGAKAAEMESFDDQWWFDVYNTAATKVTGKKTKSRAPTDEELFKACGGRRLCSQGGAHYAGGKTYAGGKLSRADRGQGSGIAGADSGHSIAKKAKKGKKKRKLAPEDDAPRRPRTRSMDAAEKKDASDDSDDGVGEKAKMKKRKAAGSDGKKSKKMKTAKAKDAGDKKKKSKENSSKKAGKKKKDKKNKKKKKSEAA
eukprot:g2093.t1